MRSVLFGAVWSVVLVMTLICFSAASAEHMSPKPFFVPSARLDPSQVTDLRGQVFKCDPFKQEFGGGC